jgi:hypothetical protein
MQNWTVEWFNAMVKAWQKQMLLPLPEKLKNRRAGKNEYEMGAFVLLGFIVGLAAVLAGGIAELFFNRFSGALIFALAGWLLWIFHDHGRGDGLISQKLADLLPGDVLPYRAVLPVFMTILKYFLLFALFFKGGRCFLSLVFAGIFALEVLLIREAGFSPPVVNDSGRSVTVFWVVTALIVIFNFLLQPLCSVFAALVFALMFHFCRMKNLSGSEVVNTIRYTGAAAGWLMLLCGILFI